MMDERGAVYAIVLGFGVILLLGVMFYMFNHAFAEVRDVTQPMLEENSLARRTGESMSTIWSVILVVFIIIIVSWIFVQGQRRGSDYG